MPEPALRSSRVALRALRPTDRDYQHLADIWNATESDHPTTPQEMRFNYENTPPRVRWGVLFAEISGRAVGRASYGNDDLSFHPRRFNVSVRVLPEFRRQGVGGALYDAARVALAPFRPISLHAMVDEARPEALRFAVSRGFAEEARFFESRLNLGGFDPAPYADLQPRLMARGLRLRPLADLMAAVPDYRERIYDLDWACTQDEPLPLPAVQPEREPWIAAHFGRSELTPDAYLVAVAGDSPDAPWVGLSELYPLPGDAGTLYNGFTGVLRAYRGLGLATALKVANLRWAQAQGYREVRTWNNSLNDGMLRVNAKLGFVREPADIALRKTLREEE